MTNDELDDHRARAKLRNSKNKFVDVPIGMCLLRDLGLAQSYIYNGDCIDVFVIKKQKNLSKDDIIDKNFMYSILDLYSNT